MNLSFFNLVTATKKRPDPQKLDVHKTKDKDKDRDKDRDKDKEREKDKDRDKSKDKDKDKKKSKSGESMKSPLTELYGTIDAKKAVKGSGLQKFKIPKKRPSIEARPEQKEVSVLNNAKITLFIDFW
jgi:Ni/Co efflux regulator RcnB